MNISSSSLFRFRTEFRYIKEIITDGFGFRPCVEEISLNSYENNPFEAVVPHSLSSMAVCFCDLPLSQSQDHRAEYGQYAIAMSKEWAMRQGITPIRYYHSQSPFQADSTTRDMLSMLANVRKTEDGFIGVMREFLMYANSAAPTDDEMKQLPDSVKRLHNNVNGFVQDCLEQFFGAFHFTRICEGVNLATSKQTQRKFYDEREWRAVSFNQKKQALTFDLADVRHIIVTTEDERAELGELIISQSEKLKIADPTRVWGIVKIGSEIFGDI